MRSREVCWGPHAAVERDLCHMPGKAGVLRRATDPPVLSQECRHAFISFPADFINKDGLFVVE